MFQTKIGFVKFKLTLFKITFVLALLKLAGFRSYYLVQRWLNSFNNQSTTRNWKGSHSNNFNYTVSVQVTQYTSFIGIYVLSIFFVIFNEGQSNLITASTVVKVIWLRHKVIYVSNISLGTKVPQGELSFFSVI